MKRYLETHLGWIATNTLIMLAGGYVLAGNASWGTMLALCFAFFMGVRLGFGEAVERFKARNVRQI